MPREKPKLREQILEIEGLGTVMVRNTMMSRWLELLELKGVEQNFAVLQETVREPDGSPLGWDATDWNVFAGNHPKSYSKLLEVSSMWAGKSEDVEKKEEAPSTSAQEPSQDNSGAP